jgi:hypothetical protein
MADNNFMDFLDGLSGAFGGITKGLTAGAEPFNAWEKVRTQDLANDKTDIQLRDLGQTQDARDAYGGYYDNVVGLADTNNRVGISKGNRDIFGNEQALAQAEYLASPGFQEIVAQLDPSDPEYRTKLAAAIAQYDPLGGVTAYDKFGVDKMQQRNLNMQTAGQFIERYAQQKDPGAVFQFMPDGTAVIYGSDGTMTPIPTKFLLQLADMTAAKTPNAAITSGIGDQIKVNASNIATYNALNKNNVSPAQQVQLLTQERLAAQNELTAVQNEIKAITSSEQFKLLSRPEQEAALAGIKPRFDRAVQNQQAVQQRIRAFQSGQSPASGGAMGPPSPRVAPQGGGAVTTGRPSVADVISLAAGGAGAPKGAPWGRSAEGGGAYPFMQMNPEDVWGPASNPISGDQNAGDSALLIQQLQNILGPGFAPVGDY